MGKRRRKNRNRMRVVKVFVYGSMCTGGQLRPHIEHAIISSVDAVTFGKLHMVAGTWYPGMWEGNEIVVGEVITIRKEYLPILDDMECHGDMYQRTIDKVIVEEGDGSEVDAYIYMALDIPKGEEIVNGDYIVYKYGG